MSPSPPPAPGFLSGLAHDASNLASPAAWGFTLAEYAAMARRYPTMLRERAFKLKSTEQMEADAQAKGSLKRTLGPFGLTCVGVGLMLGAGIFLAPGQIALQLTGPAVCLSYLVAAVSAFLSCFCYAEFAVDMPLAGAAYNYIAVSLGEFIAWVVSSNLVFEYILASASVIRGFSTYFAVLIGQDSGYFLYSASFLGKEYTVDWWAFGLTLLLTALLSFGAKESTTANTLITVAHVAVMAFIIIAGFTQADTDNFSPFFPQDQPDAWKNIFNGAGIAFFSFVGFDAVATAAEEVVDPVRHMPVGILASMSLVTIIYVLMCVVLCLMVPRQHIQLDATFAAAFEYVGMGWAKHVVALGAIMGILTSTMMGIYAPARVLTGCTREGMLPPFLSWVGPRQTPWVATWTIGTCVALIALLQDFAELSNMVSIGTFTVFWFVAAALIWRRSHVPGQTSRPAMLSLCLHLGAMVAFSVAFVCVWSMPQFNYAADGAKGPLVELQWKLLLPLGACCAATPLSMYFLLPPAYTPARFRVPLYPFVPCASLFVNTFLLGQLDPASYVRFGFWSLAVVAIYMLYGVFAAANKDANSPWDPSLEGKAEKGMAGAVVALSATCCFTATAPAAAAKSAAAQSCRALPVPCAASPDPAEVVVEVQLLRSAASASCV